MKLTILVSAFVLVGPTSALANDKFGETCAGTETVQIGAQGPKTVPFELAFSVDLSAKSYCYDKCGPDQSYAISNARSDPVRLADVDHGGQIRLTTFDRRTGRLTDDQSYDAGLARIVRKATAQCHVAAFHEPANQTGLKL